MPFVFSCPAMKLLEVLASSTCHSRSSTKLESALQEKVAVELNGARTDWGLSMKTLESAGDNRDPRLCILAV